MIFRNGKIIYAKMQMGDGKSLETKVLAEIVTKLDYSKSEETMKVRIQLEAVDDLLYFTEANILEDIREKYVRIAVDKHGKIQAIGHMLDDLYFAVNDLYSDDKEKKTWKQSELRSWERTHA